MKNKTKKQPKKDEITPYDAFSILEYKRYREQKKAQK